LAFIFLIDVFYLVNGRSGQIVAISLILLFIFKSFRRSYSFLALAFIALAFSIFPSFSSYIIPERLLNLHNEIQLDNNVGGRWKMYESSVVLIKNNPFFGTGTGSTYTEIKKMNFVVSDIKGGEVQFLTSNPHNQYLLTLIELGFLGLFLLLNFFYSCYSQTKILRQNIMKDYSQGLLLLMIIGCLFNSLLLDATEGRFFCIMMGIILSSNNIQKRKL
jgi:O-antigen ligase